MVSRQEIKEERKVYVDIEQNPLQLYGMCFNRTAA